VVKRTTSRDALRDALLPEAPPEEADAPAGESALIGLAVTGVVVLAVAFILLVDSALRSSAELPDVLRPTPAAAPPLGSSATAVPVARTPAPVEIALPVPAVTDAPPLTPTPLPALGPPRPRFIVYTVKSGDTIGLISQQFGFPVSELARINGIEEPYLLQIGHELIIPNT